MLCVATRVMIMRMNVVPPQRSSVLLVEDDPNDEFLTCRVLRKEAQLTDITVARDGADALDYLFARGLMRAGTSWICPWSCCWT